MTKQEIVKQIARETGVEAATVLAVVEGLLEKTYRNFFGIYFLFISLYCYPSKDGQHLLQSKRGNLQ